jgi:hypothetical protein
MVWFDGLVRMPHPFLLPINPMQHRPLIKQATTVLGIALEVIAIVALIAWFQAGDPECFYDTGVFAQIRLCDSDLAGATHPASFVYLALIIGALVTGILLHRSGGTPAPANDEDSHPPDSPPFSTGQDISSLHGDP